MPFTPYHFGPNGFFGLVFRKWIDLPMFLLANVIIDVEVLFARGWTAHRVWHFHTFLVGGAVCGASALLFYPARHFFGKVMTSFHLPYETSVRKMIFSGVLGGWFHVLLDSIYHYDVQPFWPWLNKNPLWGVISWGQVKSVCIGFVVAAVVVYLVTVIRAHKAGRKIN
jgi:membrane-bound metal-dependent hydrolase YbcI (DUF457 family)